MFSKYLAMISSAVCAFAATAQTMVNSDSKNLRFIELRVIVLIFS